MCKHKVYCECAVVSKHRILYSNNTVIFTKHIETSAIATNAISPCEIIFHFFLHMVLVLLIKKSLVAGKQQQELSSGMFLSYLRALLSCRRFGQAGRLSKDMDQRQDDAAKIRSASAARNAGVCLLTTMFTLGHRNFMYTVVIL